VEGGGEDLTFGAFFGGNFIGLLIAVVVPIALLTLWVSFVTVIAIPLTDQVAIFMGISSVFSAVASSPSGQVAMHLLYNAFPVVLCIRLVTARLFLQFTMTKAMLACCAASRLLFGK
jgi:large-conductance mechanosensitive channel